MSERVAMAKALLKQAGYDALIRYALSCSTTSTICMKRPRSVVFRMEKMAGCTGDAAHNEWKTYLDARRAGDFMLSRQSGMRRTMMLPAS